MTLLPAWLRRLVRPGPVASSLATALATPAQAPTATPFRKRGCKTPGAVKTAISAFVQRAPWQPGRMGAR